MAHDGTGNPAKGIATYRKKGLIQGPSARVFHKEAYSMWAEGKTFPEIAAKIGKSSRRIQSWAKEEGWRQLLEESHAKARTQLVDQQADELVRMALRHRKGARAFQKYARRMLKDGTIMIDPMSGQVVLHKNKETGTTTIPLRDLTAQELQQATQAFLKAADLEYGRAGGKADKSEVDHRFPDLATFLERIWQERSGVKDVTPPPKALVAADPRRRRLSIQKREEART